MSIAEPPPEVDPWEQFTRALILERFGKTCPEVPREERARERAEAAERNAVLATWRGGSTSTLRAIS